MEMEVDARADPDGEVEVVWIGKNRRCRRERHGRRPDYWIWGPCRERGEWRGRMVGGTRSAVGSGGGGDGGGGWGRRDEVGVNRWWESQKP